MVALGDPRLAAPFEVSCPVAGQGSWADPRNWVYDFNSQLPGGVRCTFTLARGLKTLAGEPLGGPTQFSFNTGGPAIVASYPQASAHRIDENQVFLLKTDAAVDASTVRAHVQCLVDGIADQIPVEVLEGATRADVLGQRDELGYGYDRLVWGDGAESSAKRTAARRNEAEAQITALRCLQRLPPATGITLRWGAGVASATGMATTAEHKLRFTVRSAFTARVECRRSNARAGCLPFEPITLSFSAPVPSQLALKARLQLASGVEVAPVETSQPGNGTLESVHFAPPFPDGAPVVVSLPPVLVDDAQRPLENAARFPLEVRVDVAPPLVKFSGSFGILEWSEGGVLPLTVRNVEPALAASQLELPAKLLHLADDPGLVARWLTRVEAAGESRGEMVARKKVAGEAKGAALEWREDTGSRSVFDAKDAPTSFTVSKAAGAQPMEVVGIPLKKPGFYVVEVESRVLGRALLGREQTRYVATAALVTDLAVHFQWGRDASSVWVTRLHDGSPVAEAEVAIVRYCGGEPLWTGRTNKDGIAAVAQSLGEPRSNNQCYAGIRPDNSPLLVTARVDADFSFTQTGWGRGIEPEQFGLMVGSDYSRTIRHTVFDRPLFRTGEIVSMKHFLRSHVMTGFSVPADLAGRKTIVIQHAASGQRYEQEAAFGADGIAESQWSIPAEAKLGDYTVSIKEDRQEWPSGSFKVEQFRLPSMRGTVTGSAQALVRPTAASVDLHVAYLSGGGASGLPVKLRTLVEPRPASYAGFSDYQFGGRPVKEGVTRNEHGAADLGDDEEAGDEEPTETVRTQVLPLVLDAAGSARVTVPKLPVLDGPSRLTAELEYTDANGEVLTATGHVDLVPSGVSVGIRREGWVASSDQLRFRVAVVDPAGKPVAGKPVEVTLYQRNYYSYRKRLIGGFYAYESLQDVRRVGVGCKGTTDAQGLLLCEIEPRVSGEVLLRAQAKDSAGNPAGATSSVWLANGDSWWFGGTAGDRMDLLPERQAYEAGDKARFQVRMPFRQATALVSVEREGVIKSFVTRLDGRHPVVEVPIEAGYAPNVYVSVLAVRGRVPHAEHTPAGRSAEEITALVDLNKPAYRLGLAVVKVGWRPHRLNVGVTADRKAYRVREHATVQIHVARTDGGALPAGTEVAVAAVDEALLDLASNRSTDLLAAMMGERGIEVRTSTAQSQVVGKRHYGRKAVPSGGGGGRGGSHGRELFDTLLLWKGRVIVDASGNAQVSVPLNDSLSSFRIIAVANGGVAYFGTGSTTIQTHQDLMLLSGLPPLVRQGDHYLATFTLRNTTARSMSVEVAAKPVPFAGNPLSAQKIALAAGQSRDLSFGIDVPLAATAVSWDVTAQDLGSEAQDRLHVTQAVIPAIPVTTFQATASQWQEGYRLPLAVPADAVPGRGGVEVALRARLADGLTGVQEYFERYPYGCFEQQTSIAIGRHDTAAWQRLTERLPAYLDGDGLLRYFPTDLLPGDDTLTAYVLAATADAGFAIPGELRARLIDGLTRFVAGRLTRYSARPAADLTLRRLAAIDALSRFGAADASMLSSISVEPDRWPLSAVLDWVGILKRVPGIAKSSDLEQVAFGQLRNRLRLSGTTLVLTDASTDSPQWLMVSPDTNAARLLLAVIDRADWQDDAGRLARGTLGRQHAGHWDTTVANAWGTIAMDRFSARFEATPVMGRTTVAYGGTTRAVDWPTSAPPRVELPWSADAATLNVGHAGTGRPWVIVRANAAVALREPVSAGFTVHRSMTPVDQHTPGHVTRGDVIRVRIDVTAAADATWVVVNDPIPAGATILGGSLNGQSGLLTQGEKRDGAAWPVFEERHFDGLRTYFRYIPKGKWSVEYTMRLNNPGLFQLPPTRVEAMYAPEIFGAVPNPPLRVEPAP